MSGGCKQYVSSSYRRSFLSRSKSSYQLGWPLFRSSVDREPIAGLAQSSSGWGGGAKYFSSNIYIQVTEKPFTSK